jgi:uncharacterized membrane protein YesL
MASGALDSLCYTRTMKAFRIMGRVLKATWEDLFLCVSMSLLWWAGVVLIVTAAPATMGLSDVANRIANYKRSGLEFFWPSARSNFWRSWLLFLALLFTLFMIILNIWFYLSGSEWLRLISLLWVWVLLFYFMVAQYLYPLLCQQTEPNLGQAFRNGALLAVRSPLYSALMVLFQATLVVASFAFVLPLLFLLPGMLAISANFALAGLLQEMELAPEPPQGPGR